VNCHAVTFRSSTLIEEITEFDSPFVQRAPHGSSGQVQMKRHRSLQKMLLLGLALFVAGALFAQRAPDMKLLVNGKTMSAAVLQINGRSYVDVETLVQITNGSVKFEPNQIVLTIPGINSDGTTPQTMEGLSTGFAGNAVTALAEMKEWKGALGTMVTYGLAVDGTWAQTYHERVETSLTQASLAATSSSDHSALQLLNNQFARLAKWESDFIAERKALNGAKTVDPNTLQNDPALTKISNCARFLSAMLVSRRFSDNASCD
jgi:hypothetical protein